ncbi:MAG TPA: hypothetical protein VMZ31_01465 [Phycisphaerae bacterium]|nr:hypothetical protein [Phycisphaerae bacterium]
MTSDGDAWSAVDPMTARLVEEWEAQAKAKPRAYGDGARRQSAEEVKADQLTLNRAVQRYIADQAALEETAKSRRILPYTGRADVRWLAKWTTRLIKAYDLASSFVLTHAGGKVSAEVWEERAAY